MRPVGVPAFRHAAGLCRQRDDGGRSRNIVAAGRRFLCRGDRERRAVGRRTRSSDALQPGLLRRLRSRPRRKQAGGGVPRLHRGLTMNDLSMFPITAKWPASHPDRIQLYSLNTPNGVKASIMLEETGLPYEPHLVRFDANDQRSAEFRSLNPYGKIPAIIDPHGPGGKPLPLFESGAILVYLADKSGQLMPRESAGRLETIQWLMFQLAGLGPMFGQVGFFHKFAGKDFADKRPRDRYVGESKRVLGVVNERLTTRAWMMGD